MAFSFIVLLIASRNIILSILAIFTVFTIILITIAILVMIGWELNILESVIITLAIGLLLPVITKQQKLSITIQVNDYCFLRSISGLQSALQHHVQVVRPL